MKKYATMLLTTVLTVSLLTGCGASSLSYNESSADTAMATADSYDYSAGIAKNSYATEAAAEDAVYNEADYESGSTQTQDLDSMTLLEEKLVYYCDLEIETLDYAGTLASVKEAIQQYGGIIQSEEETDSSYDWYYEDYRKTSGTMRNYIEVRVPSANYESFISSLDGVGKITSKSTSIENISQQYYDTTTQIEALQIQEKNLLEMLEKCETIEDMITVQDRLTTVQSDLNRLQTSKQYMDVDVAYSYVNINIEEVMEYHYDEEPIKTNTFVDRLTNTIKSTGRGFLRFLETLLFVVIRLIPYLIIVAVICFLFRKKIKRWREDRKREKAAMCARRELRQNTAIQQQAVMYQNAPQPDVSVRQQEPNPQIPENTENTDSAR